jgi:DNA-binding NarL/FixJ family response regulator
MASTAVGFDKNIDQAFVSGGEGHFVRVIVADSQAIFRAGLRKIFAVEDDIRVVGQAETMDQTFSAAKKFNADVLIMEAALSAHPAESVSELLRQTPALRLVVVTETLEEEVTLELFRRGVHGIVSREVDPDLFVECLRKVAEGRPWLENKAVEWVLEAFRTQGSRPAAARSKVQLTPKESLIVTCVTQGMKNKEIAVRVGTTEQVVKNYLRKVYDKLGVADRLELALFCLNNRMPEASSSTQRKSAESGNGVDLNSNGAGVSSDGTEVHEISRAVETAGKDILS